MRSVGKLPFVGWSPGIGQSIVGKPLRDVGCGAGSPDTSMILHWLLGMFACFSARDDRVFTISLLPLTTITSTGTSLVLRTPVRSFPATSLIVDPANLPSAIQRLQARGVQERR